ncbi:MAG: PEGA domain-containing protein [Candidatus Sulfotelmatobacter sp.]
MRNLRNVFVAALLTFLTSSLLFVAPALAENHVLGEVDLVATSKGAKDSGVWIDGQYVGYLHELKGSRKILLLPGEHRIAVREDGYLDFVQPVSVRAGGKQTIDVTLAKNPRAELPVVTSQIKLDVQPRRAAVFVDGLYVGHAGEFAGLGRALLVAPGKVKVTISQPGYQAFETNIDLLANQKTTIKTRLLRGGAAQGVSLANLN